ncbi:isocitrate lyase/phosphoenolpyruvate mutase family protein [Actinopolyspora halophila]|uniref:isocitrate lyase/phosphoenolpyruvate mutase family protein n=1 Tax=Actinopolyspora halophila TaxID=1850 RepID=UPI0012F8D6DE|nr:isocitrate lyase/phosphoenolpyruvate mutase family protein [Actinopolyspora halophila]
MHEPLVTGPTGPDAAEQAGLRAVATTSEIVARGFGFDDGENAPVDEMLTVAERMCASAAADVESGLAGTAQQAGRIAVLRKSTDETGAPLVINARVDTFLYDAPGTAEATIVGEALERGREYLAAGADCVYPLPAGVEQVIDKVVDELGTVNVLVGPNAPDFNRLAELGVARVSLGPGLGRRCETWLREEMTALA